MFIAKKDNTERDFSGFVEPLGESFCGNLAKAYERFWPANASTETTYYFHAKSFLIFLAEDPSQAEIRQYLKTGKISDTGKSYIDVLFHNLMSAYRRQLDRSQKNNRSKSNITCGVRWFVRQLGNHGIFPQNLRIKGFKFEVGIGSTLLDVVRHGEIDIESLIAKHKEILLSEGLDELEDISRLLTGIFEEAESSGKDISDDFDIVEASAHVLDDRLKDLEKASAEIIIEHYALYLNARLWAKDAFFINRAEKLNELFQRSESHKKSTEIGLEYSRLLDGCEFETLVVYCHRYHNGIVPHSDRSEFWLLGNRIYNSGLSFADVRKALGYSPESKAAAFTWLSIKYAINPEALLNITKDCLVSTGTERGYQLFWNKLRKGGDNLESVVVEARDPGVGLTADTLTAVDVINFLKDSTESIRTFAREEDKNYLFINYYKNNTKYGDGNKRIYVPSLLALGTINKAFKSLCLKVSNKRWSSTVKALRGSVLLLTGIITRDAFQVMQVGRHTDLTMATKYTFHLPEILRREKKVRDFLDWFETLLTVNIDQFAVKIGIDIETYERRKEKILNNQFGGIHCADPKAGIQPGTKSGEVCHRVDRCVSCDNRRNLFLATKENIASVIFWRDALKEAQRDLGEEDFSKWRLWLLFVNSVLDRLYTIREHRRLLGQAEEYCRLNPSPYAHLIPIRMVEEDLASP